MTPESTRRWKADSTERVFALWGRGSPETRQAVILVVDDDPQVRKLVIRLMEKAGYVVLAAADGQAGLDVSRNHAGPIDLLIADVRMPRLNGADLSAHLLRERPGIRVIFSIGETLSEFFTPSAQLPFITKPLNELEFSAKVQHILSAPVPAPPAQAPCERQAGLGGGDQPTCPCEAGGRIPVSTRRSERNG